MQQDDVGVKPEREEGNWELLKGNGDEQDMNCEVMKNRRGEKKEREKE